MSRDISLSVVIPAYNEEARLGHSLPEAARFLAEHFRLAEIIVVDDGSRDGTGNTRPDTGPVKLRVLRHERNRGKGAGLRTGALAAAGDVVLTTDADFSTPIGEVFRGLDLIASGADVVIASREAEGTHIPQDQKPLRKNMGRMFNLAVRALTGLPFNDTQCGFKLYTRAAAGGIFRRSLVDGFATDVELLVIARGLGLKVAEMPVTWINSPDSRVHILLHPVQMLADLVRIRANEIRGRYKC